MNFRENNNFNEPNDIAIVVQRIAPPLTLEQLSHLNQEVDVLVESECNGIDIYREVINFVRQSQNI